MTPHSGSRNTWKQVIETLSTAPRNTSAKIKIGRIEHPLDAGMKRIRTSPESEYRDFQMIVDAQTVCRVREFSTHYEARLQTIMQTPGRDVAKASSPEKLAKESSVSSLIKFAVDSPIVLILGATAIGAVAGAALGGKKGPGKGAMIAGGAALAGICIADAATSPERSKAAGELFRDLTNAAFNQNAPKRRSNTGSPWDGPPRGSGGSTGKKSGGKRRKFSP